MSNLVKLEEKYDVEWQPTRADLVEQALCAAAIQVGLQASDEQWDLFCVLVSKKLRSRILRDAIYCPKCGARQSRNGLGHHNRPSRERKEVI